jgi:hypothetical protein
MAKMRAVLVIAIVALLAACNQDDEPAATGEVTLEAAVAAMGREGKVFYAEFEYPAEGEQIPRHRAWYQSGEELLRTEFHDERAHRATTIISRDGEVRHDIDDGRVTDDREAGRQWKPALGGIAAWLPHIGYWTLSPDAVAEPVTVEGRELMRVHAVRIADEDAHERPEGTIHTADIYLDPATLLPTHLTVSVDYPNQDEGDVKPYTITFLITEFIDPDDLTADFFDQDALAANGARGQ